MSASYKPNQVLSEWFDTLWMGLFTKTFFGLRQNAILKAFPVKRAEIVYGICDGWNAWRWLKSADWRDTCVGALSKKISSLRDSRFVTSFTNLFWGLCESMTQMQIKMCYALLMISLLSSFFSDTYSVQIGGEPVELLSIKFNNFVFAISCVMRSNSSECRK